jgi:hypothetical protein
VGNAGERVVRERMVRTTRTTIDTAISRGVVVYVIRRDWGCDLVRRGWLVRELEGGRNGYGGGDGAGQRQRRSTPRFLAASSSMWQGVAGDAIWRDWERWFMNWKGDKKGGGCGDGAGRRQRRSTPRFHTASSSICTGGSGGAIWRDGDQ